MPRPVRLLAVLAALMLGASTARAQFTPTVAPRRRPTFADSSARRVRAVRDSIPRTKLSDLRAWVDSVTGYAAGSLPAPGSARPVVPLVPAPAASRDSTAAPRRPATADRPRTPPAR